MQPRLFPLWISIRVWHGSADGNFRARSAVEPSRRLIELSNGTVSSYLFWKSMRILSSVTLSSKFSIALWMIVSSSMWGGTGTLLSSPTKSIVLSMMLVSTLSTSSYDTPSHSLFAMMFRCFDLVKSLIVSANPIDIVVYFRLLPMALSRIWKTISEINCLSLFSSVWLKNERINLSQRSNIISITIGRIKIEVIVLVFHP